MIIKNDKNIEKSFDLLIEAEYKGNKILVYKDKNTDKLYTSKKENNKLVEVTNEEYEFINNLLEKMNG